MDNFENNNLDECNDTCDMCECEVEAMENFTPDAVEGVMVVEPADEGG